MLLRATDCRVFLADRVPDWLQEAYFAREHALVRLEKDRTRHAIESLEYLTEVQGLQYEDGHISDAVQRLGIRMLLLRKKPRRR